MKSIVVIAAMPVELEGILSRLNAQERPTRGFYKLYAAQFKGCNVYFACCGIGKVNAARTTQKAIDSFSPDAIVNMGIAGGIDRGLRTLDVVIGSEVIYHDFSPATLLEKYYPFTSSFACDKTLVKLAEAVCEHVLDGENAHHTGRIASGDCFVESGEVKERIRSLGGLCCEMEGAAIGHTATLNEVPFVIVRSISDLADEGAQMSYEEFERKASLQANGIVLGLLEAIAQEASHA